MPLPQKASKNWWITITSISNFKEINPYEQTILNQVVRANLHFGPFTDLHCWIYFYCYPLPDDLDAAHSVFRQFQFFLLITRQCSKDTDILIAHHHKFYINPN